MPAPTPATDARDARIDKRLATLRVKKNAPAKVFALADGLAVRVYASGVKTFGYVARNDKGHPQFVALGQYAPVTDHAASALTVADAFLKLLDLKRGAPLAPIAAARKNARVPNPTSSRSESESVHGGETLRHAAENWFNTKIKRKKIRDAQKHLYRQQITDHFLNQAIPKRTPVQLWGELSVAEFGVGFAALYEETLMLVEDRVALGGSRRGKCTLAHKTDVKCRAFFKHLVKLGSMKLDVVPERLEDCNRGQADTRSLTVDELERAFAETSREAVLANVKIKRTKKKQKLSINESDAVAIRLMLLTGGRLNSIRLMRRSMRDRYEKGFWTIPADDMKETNAQKEAPTPLHIPMTGLFAQETARLDALTGDFDCLFIARDARSRRAEGHEEEPISNSWAKHLAANLAERFGNNGENPYTTHALRRTQGNFLLEKGFHPVIVDRCQGRVPKGTDGTYMTAEVRDQVWNAFEQWSMFLFACMHRRGDAYLADMRDERRAESRAIEAKRMKRLGLKIPNAA